ncbi:hypothetical protein P7C70_g2172, partial [Phenoliferia sp. Uapishka_3]
MSLPQSQTKYLDVPSTAKGKNLKTFSTSEVAQITLAGPSDRDRLTPLPVFQDLSKFVDMHPGGAHVLLDAEVAGKDATEAFFGLHRAEVLNKYGRYIIGTLDTGKPRYILPTPGALSPVPFGEPAWLSEGFSSPYYNDGHRALQKYMRDFTDEYVKPEAAAHEKSGERPTVELVQKMGSELINHMRMGPSKLLKGLTLPGGIKGEDFEFRLAYVFWFRQIVTQELVRTGTRGYADGLQGGMVIGLPPVMNFGSDALKAKIIPDVLAGRKFISLAISEAFAGSDVQKLSGHFSDYFSTAVNTGKGLSMLLIERSEGVETKLIKSSYSSAAGTAYITFDNVKVPVENLLGKEGQGLKIVLSNFNHERWVMCCGSAAGSRFIVEECFKWASRKMPKAVL